MQARPARDLDGREQSASAVYPAAVAEDLSMAPATVRTHASRIYMKLGILCAEAVVARARERRLTRGIGAAPPA